MRRVGGTTFFILLVILIVLGSLVLLNPPLHEKVTAGDFDQITLDDVLGTPTDTDTADGEEDTGDTSQTDSGQDQ